MIKRFIAITFSCVLFAQSAAAGNDWTVTEIQSLLEQVDTYRMPLKEGQVFVELSVVNDGSRGRALPMRVEFSRSRERRVETLGGQRKGQRVLLTQGSYWLYMPGIKQPVRLNRLQRILGQASFGDIGKLQFSEDYRAVRWVEKDGSLQVTLTARVPGEVVDDIELWISPETGAPQSAAFLFPSGKTFKILEFSDPSVTPVGAMILTIKFIDPTRPSRYTELTYAVPERTTFTKDYFTPGSLINTEKE
jgi:hypothetical protein